MACCLNYVAEWTLICSFNILRCFSNNSFCVRFVFLVRHDAGRRLWQRAGSLDHTWPPWEGYVWLRHQVHQCTARPVYKPTEVELKSTRSGGCDPRRRNNYVGMIGAFNERWSSLMISFSRSRLRRFHNSLTDNASWIRERSHESYAKNYSVVFPFDEPLASRNMRKDPFHQVDGFDESP